MAVPSASSARSTSTSTAARTAARGSIRFMTDVMTGVPSIVMGLFIYTIWVLRFEQSGFAGALALACLMLPIVVRSTEEMLKLVPDHLREASYALGATQVAHDRRPSCCRPRCRASSAARCWPSPGPRARRRRCCSRSASRRKSTCNLFEGANTALSTQIFANADAAVRRRAQERAWGAALTLIAHRVRPHRRRPLSSPRGSHAGQLDARCRTVRSHAMARPGRRPDRSQPRSARERPHPASAPTPDVAESRPIVFDVDDLEVYYGTFRAVRDVTLTIHKNEITAFIGPSGLRQDDGAALLQPHERPHHGARVEGSSATTASISTTRRSTPVEVRRRIGMVFQKPNPFPKSIYDNIAFGPRINGVRDQGRARRRSSSRRCAAPRCGTRSRTG